MERGERRRPASSRPPGSRSARPRGSLGRWPAIAGVGTAIALAACGPAPRARDAEPTSKQGPSTSGSAPAETAGPPPAAGIVVAPSSTEALPYALLPVEGADAVVAVHQALDSHAPTLVQRFDGGTRRLDPAVEVRGFVAAAFATAEGTALLTRDGASTCVELLVGAELRRVTCEEIRADAIVRVGESWLALALDPPLPEEDEAPRATPKPRKPPPRAKRGRRTAAERRDGDEARAPARRRLTLQGRWLGESAEERRSKDPAAPEEEPFETGVEVEEPMAGLGLVGAGVRRLRSGERRVDVALHEWVSAKSSGASRALGRARFVVAGLDERGAAVEGARGHAAEADLFFGFLGGELEPQLLTEERGSLLLTAGSLRGACRAVRLTPSRVPFGPAPDACRFDPGRLLGLADRQRAPADAAREEADRAFVAASARLTSEGAHRAEWQARWDGPLVVLGPTRGFTMTGEGALRSFDRRTYEVREEPRPLVVRRARAFAAAIAEDGEALVRTHLGLRRVGVDGAVEAVVDPLPAGPPRRDEELRMGAPFARIGATWWSARGSLQRLVPPAPAPVRAAHPDASVLVGGAREGLWIELEGATVVTSAVDEGGTLRPLGRAPAPFLPGFDAVAREGGGAVVLGRERGRPDRLSTFVVDGAGRTSLAVAHWPVEGGGRAVRLAARGRAGAIAWPLEGGSAAWIDGAGAARASAPLAMDAGSPCVDGVLVRGPLPTSTPGGLAPAPDLSGGCLVGLPHWDDEGTLLAVVSRRMGAHTSVELVRARGGAGAPAATGPPPGPAGPLPAPAKAARACPAEMVLVEDRFCVDRFEASIVEGDTGRLASPDYPVTPNLFAGVLGDWATRRERVGDWLARATPLPRPAPFQLEGVRRPLALAREGILPSGYLTGLVAREACATAGKRLCTKDEWRTACRGQARARFPYGERYEAGVCNVGRPGHPAALLHGHASLGHLDPRLGRVVIDRAPGLARAGAHPRCESRWGDDAIYDMVGNLDEWIDEEGGAFAGGFFARRTTSGCDALVDSHPTGYLDYSTGVRCCATARATGR